MIVYPKRRLQVQFMTFGVEHHGVAIPIIKKSKDHGIQLAPLSSPATAQVQTSPSLS